MPLDFFARMRYLLTTRVGCMGVWIQFAHSMGWRIQFERSLNHVMKIHMKSKARWNDYSLSEIYLAGRGFQRTTLRQKLFEMYHPSTDYHFLLVAHSRQKISHKSLSVVMNNIFKKEEESAKREEWRIASTILNRLFLWFFIATGIFTFIIVFLDSPRARALNL